MTDVDIAHNPQSDSQQAQNPLTDAPVGNYRLKRLHPDASASDIRAFFDQLSSIKDDSYVSVSKKLFQSDVAESLRYTTDTYFSGKHDADTTLFRSELALIVYDWLYRQPELRQNLANILKDRNTDERASRALTEILRHCQNIGEREWVTVNEAEEKQFDELLSGERAVSTTAKFIVDYLDRPQEQKAEEELTEAEKEAQQVAVGATAVADQPTAGVPAKPGEESITEGGGAVAGQEQVAPGQPQPIDVLDLKHKLFSPEVREQVARFTQIGIVQLERFHGLPEGSLQNSKELREILSQKSLSFFATVLTQGRFDLLINSPEERFKFAREYIWLLQNDFRTKIAITTHLNDVVIKNADPNTKAKIEQALDEAAAGKKDISPLLTGIAEQLHEEKIIENVRDQSPSFQKNAEEYLSEIDQELLQSLKDLGVQTDKIGLAKTNVINVIDAMIAMRLPLDILKYIDEPRFRAIFGEDIPYRPEFIQEFLAEYWQARQSALGKQYGVEFNSQANFAIQEALELLNKNNTQGVSEKQSDTIFNTGITKPLGDMLVTHRAIGLPVKATLDAAYSKKTDSPLKESYQTYLRSRWTGFSPEEKAQILEFFGYGEPASQEVINLSMSVEFYPAQMGVIDLSPMLGGEVFYSQSAVGPAFESEYMPNNAEVHSPLGGVNKLRSKLGGFKNLASNARGLGRGLQRLIGKKATDKAVQEIVGKVANAAGTLAGTPALGKFAEWVAKNAMTKKGRRKLMFAGLGALGAIVIPLTTIGGWIGAALGGLVGFFLGGPAGAALGAIGGSWLGFGAQRWVENSLGGGGGSATLQAGGAGGSFSGGGGTPPTAAAGALSPRVGGPATQVVMATGTQAVLATVALVAGGTIFTHMLLGNALLADFPQTPLAITVDPRTGGKSSEYVTIEKRVFITGCPENKCENPAFPIKAEYAIIIKPKGDYTIAIQNATDTLKVGHSTKAWEEEGKTPPNIPDRVKNLEDFPELYKDLTLNPGEEFAFTYTETFNDNYNHAIISNKFDLEINFSNPATGESGTDNAITGAAVYIGDYSQGEGCWPATGTITQLPGGDFSHSQVDAFDIGVGGTEGIPAYYPFSGNACAYTESTGDGGLSCVYGNHIILTADRGGAFVFAHLRQMMIQPGACAPVEAGEIVGYIGNTSCNDYGVHLHFELRGSSPSPWPTTLSTLMPGGTGVSDGTPIESCYDQ